MIWAKTDRFTDQAFTLQLHLTAYLRHINFFSTCHQRPTCFFQAIKIPIYQFPHYNFETNRILYRLLPYVNLPVRWSFCGILITFVTMRFTDQGYNDIGFIRLFVWYLLFAASVIHLSFEPTFLVWPKSWKRVMSYFLFNFYTFTSMQSKTPKNAPAGDFLRLPQLIDIIFACLWQLNKF